jgi:hypothetical protein
LSLVGSKLLDQNNARQMKMASSAYHYDGFVHYSNMYESLFIFHELPEEKHSSCNYESTLDIKPALSLVTPTLSPMQPTKALPTPPPISDDDQTRMQHTTQTHDKHHHHGVGAANPSGSVDLMNPRCLTGWAALPMLVLRPPSSRLIGSKKID